MRKINILASALHLLIVLLIFALGLFFLLLYLSPDFLQTFTNLLMNKPLLVLVIGFSFTFLGIISIATFYLIHKVQYIKFSSQNTKCSINTNLIRNYLENYFNYVFPNQKNDFEVYLNSKNKLEIILNVDDLDNTFNDEYLSSLEDSISRVLSDELSYSKPFTFTLKKR